MTRRHDPRHHHAAAAPAAAAAAAAAAENLADQLHSAAIHLLRQLRKEDDASGISAPRLSALSVVVFGGPLTLGELARAEQVKPPTMTRIVTGLEKDGLVNRKDDPRDGRLTHIEATAKGRKILIAGRARRVEKLATAVGRLNREELAELRRGVQLVGDVVASMRGDRPESREAIARRPRINEERK